jgi:E3 ubiquitin-protein ligase HERC2
MWIYPYFQCFFGAKNFEVSVQTHHRLCGLWNQSHRFVGVVMRYLGSIAVITDNGTLFTFGDNEYGQLGSGTTEATDGPRQVELTNVAYVACGSEHTAAVTTSGQVYTWGKGASGQLGHGSATTKNTRLVTPTRVDSLYHSVIKVTSVALGSEHTLALTDQGRILQYSICR